MQNINHPCKLIYLDIIYTYDIEIQVSHARYTFKTLNKLFELATMFRPKVRVCSKTSFVTVFCATMAPNIGVMCNFPEQQSEHFHQMYKRCRAKIVFRRHFNISSVPGVAAFSGAQKYSAYQTC